MSYLKSTQQNVKEIGDFLAKIKWTYFATLTTPNPMTINQGRRYLENYFNYLLELGFKPTIFWVIEPFSNKENGYHIHALIKIEIYEDVKTLLETLKKAWRQISRGSSISSKTTQIAPYLEEKGANYYVAKYIFSKNVEYDILI